MPHELPTRDTRVFKWRKREPVIENTEFRGESFSPPPTEIPDPQEYFKIFWDDSIMNNLVEQTNLYSVQKTGKSIDTNLKEMQQFIGINLLMSIVQLPSYTMYWSADCRCEPVASVMSLKRYQSLRRFLHAVDNSTKDESSDKLFKVKPVLEGVRQNCLKIDQEPYQSLDEQMIPAKTKRSGILQHLPKKIHKWGFKNFVRAGKSGFIYDFFLYAGSKSAGTEKCGVEDVVMRLLEEVPRHKGYRILFDNWFSTLRLMTRLKSEGILATATFRTNRIGNCPLSSDKELRSQGRGSYDYKTDQNTGIHLIKWYDNKSVLIGSTFSGVESRQVVRRWDSKTKAHVHVSCPDMIIDYNSAMGGVDLADMLISLYRTKMNPKKRWYLKLIFHCVDIAKVNGWLLYRRHCFQTDLPKNEILCLRKFILQVARSLCMKDADLERRVGRPSKRSISPPFRRGKKPHVAKPTNDIRNDGIGHWPEVREKRNRCRNCSIGFSFIPLLQMRNVFVPEQRPKLFQRLSRLN